MTAIALTIAGADSGGGAGIAADLKTFAALQVYGAAVITALTAQNTQGVTGVLDVPADFVAAQIDAVYSDLSVAATKIGMLSRGETIAAVAAGLARHAAKNVVLDPVMVAASGERLLAPDAIAALKQLLVPRALVVTPNLAEAAALLDTRPAADEAEMRKQGEAILSLGCEAVVMKGGHGEGIESADLLIDRSGVRRYAAQRLDARHTHGTGCTLSSAIAAGLAKGMNLPEAMADAKKFVTLAIAAAGELSVGQGIGPLHHFHAQWPKA
jgi:hydroxymethylpyrimidine/phosphomethylpyrimidine kinase